MTTVLIFIAAIISSILYSKLSFSLEIALLISSYKKTLSFAKNNEINNNQIKESLAQMKVLMIVFLKFLIVILPFLLVVLYITNAGGSVKVEIFNLLNNAILIVTFFITKFILNNGK